MRHLKLLGLALFACFAFAATAASVAAATEPGLLFLATEAPPVTLSATKQAVVTTFESASGAKIVCGEIQLEGKAGKAGETHVTLGELTVVREKCKAEGVIGCTSENTKGEKDAKEVILEVSADRDIHFVALLTITALVPGILVAYLELENKLDLTLNCGGPKFLVLGATAFEVKGKNLASEEATEIEILPTLLPCDASDTLCKEELLKWQVVVGGVPCPLAISLPEKEECFTPKANKPIVVKIKPMVLIDF